MRCATRFFFSGSPAHGVGEELREALEKEGYCDPPSPKRLRLGGAAAVAPPSGAAAGSAAAAQAAGTGSVAPKTPARQVRQPSTPACAAPTKQTPLGKEAAVEADAQSRECELQKRKEACEAKARTGGENKFSPRVRAALAKRRPRRRKRKRRKRKRKPIRK